MEKQTETKANRRRRGKIVNQFFTPQTNRQKIAEEFNLLIILHRYIKFYKVHTSIKRNMGECLSNIKKLKNR